MYTLHDADGSYPDHVLALSEPDDAAIWIGDAVRIADHRGDWIGTVIEPNDKKGRVLIELVARVEQVPMRGSRPPLGSKAMVISATVADELLSAPK